MVPVLVFFGMQCLEWYDIGWGVFPYFFRETCIESENDVTFGGGMNKAWQDREDVFLFRNEFISRIVNSDLVWVGHFREKKEVKCVQSESEKFIE